MAVALIKPQLGLPFVLVLGVCLGRWRAVVAGAAVAAALAAIPTVLVISAAGGVGAFVDSAERNLELSTELGGNIAGRDDLLRVDIWGAIGKLADVNPTTATQLATLVVFIGLAAVAIRRRGLQRPPVLPAPVIGLLTVGVLAAMPHYPYDLTLLAPLVLAALFGPWGDPPQRALAAGLALLGAAGLFHLGFVDSALSDAGIGLDLRSSIDATLVTAAYIVALVTTLRIATSGPPSNRVFG